MRPESHLIRRPLRRWSRAGLLACAACLVVLLPACESGGNFSVLGYTTQPNYDPKYKTVRVPIFQNKTYRRGLEFDLTEAVGREIERSTPMKVVTAGQPADTELIGTIMQVNKNLLNFNPTGEIREGETTLAVDLVWRDLHTGEILSRPGGRPLDPRPFDPLVQQAIGVNVPGLMPPSATAAPSQPVPPVPAELLPGSDPLVQGQPRLPADPPLPVIPMRVRSISTFIPELGESTTTSYKRNVDRLAVQIVSMMEKPW